jgi:hypothetical protein
VRLNVSGVLVLDGRVCRAGLWVGLADQGKGDVALTAWIRRDLWIARPGNCSTNRPATRKGGPGYQPRSG